MVNTLKYYATAKGDRNTMDIMNGPTKKMRGINLFSPAERSPHREKFDFI